MNLKINNLQSDSEKKQSENTRNTLKRKVVNLRIKSQRKTENLNCQRKKIKALENKIEDLTNFKLSRLDEEKSEKKEKKALQKRLKA